MAEPLVLDGFWREIEPLIPKHAPDPRGGAPRKPDRACLEGIIHVLQTGTQWQKLPRCERWPSGSTCWRRFSEWTAVGLWPQLHRRLLNLLGAAGEINLDHAVVDSASVRAKKGGDHTGPNPVDRAKKGCKRHVITDAGGLPLLVHCTPANVRDDAPFLEMLDSMPPVKLAGPGRPRYKPHAMVGDAAYGFRSIIREVVQRRIDSLLAPRGTRGHPATHGSGLGRVRYVVERTIAWFANFRRIVQCYERTGSAWQALNEIACCVICATRLRKIADARMAA
jgi:transposase